VSLSDRDIAACIGDAFAEQAVAALLASDILRAHRAAFL